MSENSSTNPPPFVDMHTHRHTQTSGVLSVVNFSQKDFSNDSQNALFTEGVNFCSIGLHPWFLTKENKEKDFERLSQLASNHKVTAIGECGLDKVRGKDLVLQTEIFEQQIRLAETVSKPVVIHCVRAFGEVIAVKKRLNPTVPLIIHGFNKNESVLKELIRHDFYISIGGAILEKKRLNTEWVNFTSILREIPLNRLFFETDDKDNVEISDIYKAASILLDMDLNELRCSIYENFGKFHFA
ncbi:MAG: TatD family hydrolase [Saprospiraceae bacterium]|nr:TatD family hydrolase [Saprospiraceae bacterium]